MYASSALRKVCEKVRSQAVHAGGIARTDARTSSDGWGGESMNQ